MQPGAQSIPIGLQPRFMGKETVKFLSSSSADYFLI
jgi:hypothetical protein